MYRDSSIKTLNPALHTLYSISESKLTYQQRLDVRNIYADMSYSPYVQHRTEHEIITLTFPRECTSISNLTNNYGCKMVYYWQVNGFVSEVEIKPGMTVSIDRETVITIYTRSKPDLVITFDMTLTKPSIQSKL